MDLMIFIDMLAETREIQNPTGGWSNICVHKKTVGLKLVSKPILLSLQKGVCVGQ